MILSELVGRVVRDGTGQRIGRVIDARFLLRRPAGAGHSTAALYGLVVGQHRSKGLRGYERSDMRGPFPIAQWIRWRQRGTFLVRWEDIDTLDDADTVRLRPGFTRYDPRLPKLPAPPGDEDDHQHR